MITKTNLSSLKSEFMTLRGSKVSIMNFNDEDLTVEYLNWLNDPQVVRYSNQRHRRHDESSCSDYLRSFDESSNLFLKIVRLFDNKTVGTMTAYVSIYDCTVDMGIMLGERSAWNRGLGHDAWITLLKWFLEEKMVRKVTAGTMKSNYAMVKIMENCEMKLEAVRPGQVLLDGVPQDMVYYGKFSCF